METTLHKELKEQYAAKDAETEVKVGAFRIDVVDGVELIEIQHGSLAALRDKVRTLLEEHRVRIVKPLIARKLIIKQDAREGAVVSRRASPKRGTLLDVFDELVYFTRVFPHRRLALEVLLVEIEEWRYPGHGRRRRWRAKDYQVEDQRLLKIHDRLELRTAADLKRLLPAGLPKCFHTAHLAEGLGVERWVAQRIAYCLRHAGTVRQVGKQGNALLYELASRRRAA